MSIYQVKNMNQNPLQKYFRQPVIHIALPSGGQFYPTGSLDLPPTGEVPIYPMTAVDELRARTPDALFNGSALADIIASCVPNIKNAWNLPVIDLNALLAAIRLASYGYDMEIGTNCPKCGFGEVIAIDLRSVLTTIGKGDYDTAFVQGDLSFYFKPISYQQLNDINRTMFEDQKLIEMANGDNNLSDEDRRGYLGQAYRHITDLTFRSIASTVSAIKSPDALVTDEDQIYDFLTNCPKTLYQAVKDHTISLRETSDLKPIGVTCNGCQHQYEQEFTLDISNFFETAS